MYGNRWNDKIEIIQGDSLELISPTEIDMQIKTAKTYPRVLADVKRDVIELATASQANAESCFYELPAATGRGKISGPSARMAEIISSCWMNSMSGSKIVEISRRFVKAQGFFFDLQKNTRNYVEVTRSIIKADGTRFPDHLINTTCMAAMSIAKRNATFQGVPMAYFIDIENRIKETALGNIKDLEKSRREALDLFLREYEADKAEICKYLHIKSVEDIGMDELWSLKKLLTTLKENPKAVDEIFKRKQAKESTSASKAAFGDKNTPKAKGQKNQPKQTTIDGK